MRAMITLDASEARELEDLRRRLLAQFSLSLSPEVVRRSLDDAVAHYAGAPVRRYVPIFVERRVRSRLRDALLQPDPALAEPLARTG
jgi:hypothetical protein